MPCGGLSSNTLGLFRLFSGLRGAIKSHASSETLCWHLWFMELPTNQDGEGLKASTSRRSRTKIRPVCHQDLETGVMICVSVSTVSWFAEQARLSRCTISCVPPPIELMQSAAEARSHKHHCLANGDAHPV